MSPSDWGWRHELADAPALAALLLAATRSAADGCRDSGAGGSLRGFGRQRWLDHDALRIGAPVYLAQAAAVASLLSTGLGFTFNVSALYVGSDPGALAATDLTLVFNQKAQCTSADNVRLVVVQ